MILQGDRNNLLASLNDMGETEPSLPRSQEFPFSFLGGHWEEQTQNSFSIRRKIAKGRCLFLFQSLESVKFCPCSSSPIAAYQLQLQQCRTFFWIMSCWNVSKIYCCAECEVNWKCLQTKFIKKKTSWKVIPWKFVLKHSSRFYDSKQARLSWPHLRYPLIISNN